MTNREAQGGRFAGCRAQACDGGKCDPITIETEPQRAADGTWEVLVRFDDRPNYLTPLRVQYLFLKAPKDAQPEQAQEAVASDIDSLQLYKTLRDLTDEAGAVDTVIGRPDVLRRRLAALRDAVGQTRGDIPTPPAAPTSETSATASVAGLTCYVCRKPIEGTAQGEIDHNGARLYHAHCKPAASVAGLSAAAPAVAQPTIGMFDSIQVAAMWREFMASPTYRQAMEYLKPDPANLSGFHGALFVAFRDGLWTALSHREHPAAQQEILREYRALYENAQASLADGIWTSMQAFGRPDIVMGDANG